MLRDARRVLIVGPCGAGKSHLSSRLGEILGLPLVHLDAEYWRPGWVPTPKEQWRERVDALIAPDRWLIEGTYLSTLARRLERAEVVLHLDYSPRVCLPRVAWRIATGWGRTRPDMAPGCPEHIDRAFLVYAWRFRRVQRPRILAAMEASGVPAISLASPQETEAFLASMKTRF